MNKKIVLFGFVFAVLFTVLTVSASAESLGLGGIFDNSVTNSFDNGASSSTWYEEYYTDVTVLDPSTWPYIISNALVYIAGESPLAETAIGNVFRLALVSSNFVTPFVTILTSLGVMGVFVALYVIIDHLRHINE